MASSRTIGSLFTENRCILCGGNLSHFLNVKYDLCPECVRLFENHKRESFCSKCSIPLISENNLCMRCRGRKYSFRSNYSVFLYRGPVKELIYQYKFRNNRKLAYFFAEIFYRYFFQYFRAELIIPVPSAGSSVRKRGFDHMALIGKILSNEYAQPVSHCLIRKKGKQQKELSYRERLVNLVGNIQLRNKNCNLPGSVILLDDIFTTGATMEQCTRAVISAGARHVTGLTIAID